MTTLPRLARRVALVALPLSLGACEWFTDFKDQPKIEPWEAASQRSADSLTPPRGNPQFSVPVTGTAVAGYQVSYRPLPNVIDSLAGTANPTPVNPASLANGRKFYSINCAVCHGDTGAGNGPAVRYGMAGINLLGPATQARTDGYIYGVIRNGRGIMPTYNRIEELDRWDVVNYVRALQGRTPNTAGVGRVGYPGQNGATVPGYSPTAPTRPAPHWRDARGPMPTPGAGAATDSAVPREPRTPQEPAPGRPTAPRTGADSSATSPSQPARRNP
jgi:mono/diheme cytochrome c family protein